MSPDAPVLLGLAGLLLVEVVLIRRRRACPRPGDDACTDGTACPRCPSRAR